MSISGVLREFQQEKKLLVNLRENHATQRLAAMWKFLSNQKETSSLIERVMSENLDVLGDAKAGKKVNASRRQQIVAVGFYVMETCHTSNMNVTGIAKTLGIVSSDGKPSRQSYVNDTMHGYVDIALEYIEEELQRMADGEDAYGSDSGKGEVQGLFAEGENQLVKAFLEFLENEKDYPFESFKLEARGLNPKSSAVTDMVLVVSKTGQNAAVIEFRYRNDQKSLADAMFQVERYRQSLNQPNIPAYIVCPSLDKSSEPFEIYEIIDNGYESLLSINDFPAYEDLKKKVDTKTEASVGEDGGKNDVQEIIEEAARDGRKKLDLSNRGITELPEEIGKLESLETLHLFGNQLREVPTSFEKLESLTELNIHNNQLTEVPKEICQLASLTLLNLSTNRLRELPKEIGKLERLKRLFVSDNQLTSVPKEIGKLKNLLVLYLNNNQLTELPKEIEELDRLIDIILKGNNIPEKEIERIEKKLIGRQRPIGRVSAKYVDDFKSELTGIGKELFDKLIELIKSDPSFIINPKSSSYININIKKPSRVAFQIHRVADDSSQLGIAIAGWSEKDPEKGNRYAIVRRDIGRLSGLHDSTQENYWLRGKIDSGAKGNFPLYEAKVYIIDPGMQEDEEAWGELRELLQYAKEITGRGKIKEFVSEILKVLGRIATLRSDEVSDVDDLGRETLIDAFADTIIHTDFNNGFTLALMGNWGEGKSSVMEILKKKLKERQKGRFDFALFNAWEYEQTGKTAAGLAQEVVKGLREKNFFKRQLQRVAFAYKENKLSLLILVGFVISPVLLYLLRQYYDPTLLTDYLKEKPNLKEFLDGLIKVAYVILPLFGIGIFKKSTEHPLDIQLQTYFKLPDYGEHLGLIPVLKRHITTLCKLKLKRSIRIPFTKIKIGKDRKLLVFVDDLDRCKSVYIAETLDAIRLVMTIPNVIVMICIDHRIAFKAIERHYRTLAEVEEEDGNRRSSAEVARDYLGKIIQLPVRLEPVKHGKLKKYVYEKLFLFEEEKWKRFKETSEAAKVILPKVTSSLNVDKSPEPGTSEEGKGKTISAGEGGQRFDANALKPKQDKREQARKSDDKKNDDIEIKDRPEEGKEFYRLAGLFEFSNPRQLLRLHNSFRFLKALGRGRENDTLDILRMLFWQEFLHNWPIVIRHACMAVLIEVHAEKVKPIANRVMNKVREDIIKLFNELENYAELAEFVRIVVLPHSEEGVLDTREEIEEWRNKREEGEARGD